MALEYSQTLIMNNFYITKSSLLSKGVTTSKIVGGDRGGDVDKIFDLI